MVSELKGESHTHWLNGSSAPCTGIFKPVWLPGGLPDLGTPPTGQFCLDSLWWQHEVLHRQVLKDYVHRLELYRDERDALEADFLAEAERLEGASDEERREFSFSCFEQASRKTKEWSRAVKEAPLQMDNPALYDKAWSRVNKDASFRADKNESTTIPGTV
jgi:hypothetical protein